MGPAAGERSARLQSPRCPAPLTGLQPRPSLWGGGAAVGGALFLTNSVTVARGKGLGRRAWCV